MYFSTVIVFSALSSLRLVGAVPVSPNSLASRTKGPISIPLSKRSNYLNHDGLVDLDKLQAGVHHTEALVLPFAFFMKKLDPYRTVHLLGDSTKHIERTKETQVNPTPLH